MKSVMKEITLRDLTKATGELAALVTVVWKASL